MDTHPSPPGNAIANPFPVEYIAWWAVPDDVAARAEPVPAIAAGSPPMGGADFASWAHRHGTSLTMRAESDRHARIQLAWVPRALSRDLAHPRNTSMGFALQFWTPAVEGARQILTLPYCHGFGYDPNNGALLIGHALTDRAHGFMRPPVDTPSLLSLYLDADGRTPMVNA